jgi:ribosomal protein L18
MADLTATAAQVAPVNETQPIITTMVSAAAVTAGQLVYETTAGKGNLARANATGTVQTLRGIALQSVAANRPFNVLEKGSVYGFDLSGLNPGAAVFASAATAGALADAAPSTSGQFVAAVATVRGIPEGPNGATIVKVLYVDVDTAHAAYVAVA